MGWGVGYRNSLIIEVDNIVVCSGQNPKNDQEITVREGRREGGRRVVTGSRR